MSENRWNKYQEQLVKRWAEMGKIYSIMHSLCAQHYSKWDKLLGVPVVVIGGITASSIFSSTKDNSDIWVYINGTMALLVTALAGVSNFLGTAEKTTKHQNASFKYTRIAMDIDTLLSFGRTERKMSPQEFIHTKKAEILEIRENVPEVLPWVMSNYLKTFEKSLTNTRSLVCKKGPNTVPVFTQPVTFENMPNVQRSGSDSLPIFRPTVVPSADHDVGAVLSDFDDTSYNRVLSASRQMRGFHAQSEADSDSEDEAIPEQRDEE